MGQCRFVTLNLNCCIWLLALAKLHQVSPVPADKELLFKCPSDGYFAHQQNCNKFYQCVGGQVILQKCGSGLYFDTIKKVCTWKNAAYCGSDIQLLKTNETSDFHITEATSTNTSSNKKNDSMCTEDQTLCLSQTICIQYSKFCDRKNDCPDESDERSCGLKLLAEEIIYQTCGPEESLCSNGSACIHNSKLCNGVFDCADKSDELSCEHEDNDVAPECDVNVCKLPHCFCSKKGNKIPGNLQAKNVPQIVLLTFDDAVNELNYHLYNKLFLFNHTNPNGCPIKGTFYVSHEYTNYFYVQQYYERGHEIAVHSISHRTPQTWWHMASEQDWIDEIQGQKEILHNFAQIPMEQIRGMRAPFLQVGGNKQFSMLNNSGFLYDSSMATPQFSFPVWPFTLDFHMPLKCLIHNCPTHSFPGIWEMVMNQLKSSGHQTCAMIDQCPLEENFDAAYKFLYENFQNHYQKNRAPLGLYFHTNWLQSSQRLNALQQFIDDILSRHDDVWFITTYQLIQWIQNPTSLEHINSFLPWQCNNEYRRPCKRPNRCRYVMPNKQERYIVTCSQCPKSYPWVRNTDGRQ